jgi:hypothetical protein
MDRAMLNKIALQVRKTSTYLAQKLGQVQLFLAVSPQRCVGSGLTCIFWPT